MPGSQSPPAHRQPLTCALYPECFWSLLAPLGLARLPCCLCGRGSVLARVGPLPPAPVDSFPHFVLAARPVATLPPKRVPPETGTQGALYSRTSEAAAGCLGPGGTLWHRGPLSPVFGPRRPPRPCPGSDAAHWTPLGYLLKATAHWGATGRLTSLDQLPYAGVRALLCVCVRTWVPLGFESLRT